MLLKMGIRETSVHVLKTYTVEMVILTMDMRYDQLLYWRDNILEWYLCSEYSQGSFSLEPCILLTEVNSNILDSYRSAISNLYSI